MTMRESVARAITRCRQSGKDAHETADACLRVLAETEVSDDVAETALTIYGASMSVNNHYQHAMGCALAAGWKAMLGVKPSCPACGGTGCASCLDPER